MAYGALSLHYLLVMFLMSVGFSSRGFAVEAPALTTGSSFSDLVAASLEMDPLRLNEWPDSGSSANPDLALLESLL